jgi:hypothetical protein
MKKSITNWLSPSTQNQLKILLFFIACLGGSIAKAQSVSTYTSSGSFTPPAGVTSVTVECWGGGGGGGGTAVNPSKGGGGGGGGYATAILTVTPGGTYTVTVGSGGSNGTNSGGTGGTGGTSSFASTENLVVAPGGLGGVAGTSPTPIGIGGLGATTGGLGTTLYNGGNGGNAGASNSGGGGSSAGNASNGNNATANTAGAAVTGGGGGANGRTNGGNGTAGGSPGGGGGGGWRSSTSARTGGAGGSGLVKITYVCPAVTIPLIEGFNNTTDPTCWNQTILNYGTNATPAVTYDVTGDEPGSTDDVDEVAPEEGSDMLIFNSFDCDNGSELRLATVPLNTTGVPFVDVNFYMINDDGYATSADYLQIQYSLDAGVTWVDAGLPVYRNDGTVTGFQWNAQTVHLPAAAGNVANVIVGLKFHSEYGDNIYVDNFNIVATPACSAPSGLTATNISNTGATLGWLAPPSVPSNGYDYYNSGINTAPDGTTVPTGSVAAGTTSVTLSLSGNTQYFFWVRSNCGIANGTSTWSSMKTYTTLCDPTGLPYTQDFEGAIPQAIPICTTQEHISGGSWFTVTDANDYFGFGGEDYGFPDNTLVYEDDFTGNPGNTWFYTQGLNLTAGTSYTISYKYGTDDGGESFRVSYGNSPTDAAMTNVIADYPGISNTTAITDNQTFTPATTGTYYIGFYSYSEAFSDDLFIDNINVVVTPPCPAPYAVSTANITTNSADVSWSGTGAILEYGLAGFTPGIDLTAGTGGTVVNPATSGLTISGLTPYTNYDVYVRRDCSLASNGFSTNSPVTHFTTLAIPPPNDSCSNAIMLTVARGFEPVATTGTTAGATYDPSTPESSCTADDEINDVWYSVVVPATGNLILQSSAMNQTATDYVMNVYSGDCSTLAEIGCNDDGNPDPFPSSAHSRIELSGQNPGDILLVRVRPYASADIGPFAISAWDNTDSILPAITPGGACVAGTSVQIDSADGNLYRWVPFYDASNKIVAELYANGSSLGLVNTSVYTNTSGTVRTANGTDYLDRNVTITPATEPTTTVSVRLYILNSEVSALQTADPSITDVSSLNVSQNEDACEPAIVGADQVLNQSSNSPYSTTGAYVQFDVTSFSGFFLRGGTTPLPVNLISFTGRNAGAANNLNWTTGEEKELDHFDLERSADGITYSKIASIASNKSALGSKYAYTDNSPFQGRNMYRLRMYDMSGKTILSSAIVLNVASNSTLSVNVYPNPAKQQLTVNVSGKMDGQGQVIITDIVGRTMNTIKLNSNSTAIDVSALPAGTYMVKYTDDSNSFVTKITKD